MSHIIIIFLLLIIIMILVFRPYDDAFYTRPTGYDSKAMGYTSNLVYKTHNNALAHDLYRS